MPRHLFLFEAKEMIENLSLIQLAMNEQIPLYYQLRDIWDLTIYIYHKTKCYELFEAVKVCFIHLIGVSHHFWLTIIYRFAKKRLFKFIFEISFRMFFLLVNMDNHTNNIFYILLLISLIIEEQEHSDERTDWLSLWKVYES